MTTPPDLSVIIVNWNSREYVLACLASICEAPPGLSLEILLVNNGTPDACLEAVAAAFPDVIRIEAGANLGFAKANNLGLRRAVGRYVMLLNPDTLVRPGALEAMVKYAEGDPSVGVVGPMLRNPDGSRQPSAGPIPSLRTEFVVQSYLFMLTDWGLPVRRTFTRRTERRFSQGARPAIDVGWVSGACLMLRRALLDKVGLLDEGYFMYVEDADICLQVRRVGYRVVYLPAAEVVHVGAVASTQAFSESYVHGIASKLYFFSKFRSGLAQGALRLIFVAGCVARSVGLLAGLAVPAKREESRLRLRRHARIVRLCLGVG